MKPKKYWKTILLLALLTIILLGCRSLWPGEEQSTITDDKSYVIEPSTLLQSLTQGDKKAFVLMTATPPVYPPFASEPVQWKQADYFFVAESLFQHAQTQTLTDYKLNEMDFRVDCYEVSSGFQSGGFSYFKTVQSSRLEQMMSIIPNENIVRLTEVKHIPEREKWESIDLDRVRITVDNALQIAEENGGSRVRGEVSDNCAVLAFYEAGGKYDGWLVTYFSNGSLFDINIDAQTGEFKVVR